MKKCTRLLALLLTVVMLLSMLPTMVLAAETGTEPLEYGIVHLDCGRKYFSVDSIKAIIDATKAAGMNYVQLAFGNDGLRFLLDDMELIVNGVTYTSDAVKDAIHQGNLNYNNRKGYTPSVNELTESEMNEIIAYAKTKGVGIIPLLNTPGHMDAVLDAGEDLTGQTLSYNSSKTTIDLSNDTAKAFTKAVAQKYVHYFAAKGCTAFNIGTDEYANDVHLNYPGMGFGHLVANDKYDDFIIYLNALIDMVRTAGMTPMAFNDGIYFQNNKSCGSISTDLVVQYWSQGWGSESWGRVSGYYLRHAKDLESDGFKLINAKGDFYYVVGKNDFYHYDAAEGYQHTYKSADRAGEFKLKEFYGSNVNQPVGAAYLIWCDFPAVETEGEIVSHNEEIIPVFGDTLPQCAPAKWSDETGTDPETPEPEAVTVIHEPTGISATAVGLVSIAVTVHDAVTDEEFVRISYDITLNNGAYTGAANVRIPKGTDFQNCVSFSGYADGEPISVTDEGSVLVCQVPRFSQVEIIGQLAAEGGPDVTDAVIVDLTVGERKDYTDNSGDYESSYTGDGLDTGVATVEVHGSTVGGQPAIPATTQKKTSIQADNMIILGYESGRTKRYLTRNGTSIGYTEDPKMATVWTVRTDIVSNWLSSTTYYTLSDGDYYLRPRDTSNTSYKLNISDDTSNTARRRWSYSNSNGFYYNNRYLRWNVNNWQLSNTNNNIVFAYTVVPGQDATLGSASTAITITGVAPGTTTVVVGTTQYNITVSARSGNENIALTVHNTRTLTPDVREGESVSYAVTSGTCVSVDTNGVVTGNSVGTATVVATVKKGSAAVGTYTYTIHVIEEDLSQVEPLKVQLWITNAPLTYEEQTYVSVPAQTAFTEDGIALDSIVPNTLLKEERNVYLWRGKLLDVKAENESTSRTQLQTEISSDDETTSGATFSKVRYYGSKWQVYTDQWVDVDRSNATVTYEKDNKQEVYTGERHQLIAYYLEYVDVTNEIGVYMADWGKKGDGTTGTTTFLEPDKSCSISFQLVYEDASMNPPDTDATALGPNTMVFGYWPETRGIGTVLIKPEENFEIYKVTAETGRITDKTADTWGTYRVDGFSWDSNAMTVWEDAPTSSGVVLSNNAHAPTKTGIYENLHWDENEEAILLRVYVKAKQMTNTVTVNYWNQNTGECFHSYLLDTMQEGTFSEQIGLGNDGELVNNTIPGSISGVSHTVSTNIRDLPSLPLKYRTSNYQVINVVRSNDGKTLDIYYVFEAKAAFVVDFGLPIYISSDDVGAGDLSDATVTAHDGAYGKAVFKNAERELYYVPDKVLMGPDTISIDFKKGTDTSNYLLNVYPATTVFYEANFATYSEGWTQTPGSLTASNTQTTVKAGTSTTNNYGYDAAYAGATTGAYTTNTTNAEASFSFKGTGVDVYAAGSAQSGKVMLVLKAGSTLKKLMMIDTASAGDYGPGTGKTSLNTPIATLRGLDYGEYSVTLVYFADEDRTDGFTFSGFRVYDTMGNDETAVGYYTTHLEENPVYFELRDSVLTVNAPEDGYAADIASQIYSALPTDGHSTVVFSSFSNSETSADLLYNGPKNELYLMPGQSVVFKVNTPRVAQIGLRSVTGDAVSYTINNDSKTISTSVDMFYDLQGRGATNENTYTITNTDDSGILSISTIKICDDPNGGLAPLTEEDLTKALLGMGYAAPFTPESFKMNWSLNTTTTAVTSILTITTSKDVKSLSVDGKQLRSSNVRGSKVWLYSAKEKTAGVYTYDVVAVNAEGAEYAVQAPELTVRESVIRSLFSRR